MYYLPWNLRAESNFSPVPLLSRLVPILFLLLSLGSVNGQELARHTYTHYQMGTQFRLILYTESETIADQLSQRAFARLDELNQALSDYLPESELNLLCKRAGERSKVVVSNDLWEVLRISQDLARKSKGAFDVSIGALSHVWRKAFKQRVFPAEAIVTEARRKVNYKWIKISRRKALVRLQQKEMQLDFGGIAKGYAADKMAEILRMEGTTHFLIDAGGDLLLGAAPPGRAGWRVATAQADAPPAILSHCAVATSGDTYQYLEWKGKRYSHIIDPRTGYGLVDQQQVTVTARTATLADALASTLSVLGETLGEKVLQKFPGSSATYQKSSKK
ncbi:MAG: FAD:protein FMN transferase [Saprospiraceae bacterium]|nr:FAD:protein FMN transferase [Saprospiraceae bacterium]